jgi:hypothetical protein
VIVTFPNSVRPTSLQLRLPIKRGGREGITNRENKIKLNNRDVNKI